ncbi:MAG TPA: hypothetical protein ENI61_03645 [Ignavibacteria bacterium]|nr:hypothetical protein [Ignavibacteria bacterium]
MKKVFVFVLLLSFISASAFAQMHRRMNEVRKKIEDLEKIKLLDVLHLDEPTMLKFFLRRDNYQRQIMQLNKSQEGVLQQMELQLETKNGKKNVRLINKLINKYLSIQEKIADKRAEFIKSVSDILTPNQIAKYLIFEKKFKEELRNLFFRNRMRMRIK